MSIIFSTCWYLFKAKFEPSVFQEWIHNMLSNVNNYYLVIYTDDNSKHFVTPYESNMRIKIVIKPMEEFYNYKYREQWINNHINNHSINNKVDWRVNMLWSEKIHFVEQTIKCQYFAPYRMFDAESNRSNHDIHDIDDGNQEFIYGWCDIGYFRGRKYDMAMHELSMWPNHVKINGLATNKIHYGCVNNNSNYVNDIFRMVNNKNEKGLPIQQLPPDLNTIGGGFFILDKSMLDLWKNMYDNTLKTYFDNGYLVKDDQTIITDCIFSNMSHFTLHTEKSDKYDVWFLFQRLLA